MQRLAHEHCVTVRRLTITEIAPLMGKEAKLQDESISKVFGTGRDRTAFNGTGFMATNLVGAMSALTRRLDLHYLTLLPWAQVISKRGLLRRHRAWCPKCYQEWHDNHTSVYEPLLWSINTAQVCPYHHQPLQEQCPHCHQQQLTISGDSRTGHCNKCGKWLGNNRQKTVVTSLIKSEAERNRQLNIVNNLGELVAVTPTLNSPPNLQKVSNTISTYILQVLKSSIPAFSRQSGMNKATIGLWCKGKVIPQIDNLLVLTHYLEISLLDLLTTDLLLTDSKNSSLSPKLNVVKQPRKSYNHLYLERKQVLNVVLTAVEDIKLGRERTLSITHTETIANADLIVMDNSPFAEAQMSRRKLLDMEGMPRFWIASPEDIVLQKLLWGRASRSEKQWRDVLGILKLQGDNLDYGYLTQWAERLGLVDILSQALTEAGIL